MIGPIKIDRSLNYGRDVVRSFAESVAPFQVAIDLGAGSGADLAALRSICPESALHAIELHRPNQLALASAGFEVHPLDIERDRLPFGDESVDLVVTNQTLEHTKDVFWVLHETTRVLRRGGHLIIGVPNLAGLQNRLLLFGGRQPSVIQADSAHVRGFTKADTMRLLDRGLPGGWVLSGFAGSNCYPFGPRVATSVAKWFPTLAWSIFFLLRKERSYDGGFIRYPREAALETSFWLGDGG